MSKFFPTSAFKWIDPKNFDSNKCSNNRSKGCALEVDLEEYSEELLEVLELLEFLELQIEQNLKRKCCLINN